jgi:hypothetical protein
MKFRIQAENVGTSLAEFVKEEHKRLDKFNQYWLEEHKKDPETFPLSLPANQGLWYEMFGEFWPEEEK